MSSLNAECVHFEEGSGIKCKMMLCSLDLGWERIVGGLGSVFVIWQLQENYVGQLFIFTISAGIDQFHIFHC